MMDETPTSLSFSLCDGIGPKTFLKILKYFGSSKEAFEKLNSKNNKEAGLSKNLYEKFDLFRAQFDFQAYLEKLQKTTVEVVSYTDKKYPVVLKQLSNPPIVLFCKGNLDLLMELKTIGVVGARKITSYGRDVTGKLVSDLVFYNFTIVSGLAFGVDGVAHKTTIDNKGKTIAVLGCGVDVPYPSENQDLYEQILDNGGLILSEYPLGMPPGPGTFPARNRIIAGLSLGVLVTEAAVDSGSLITAAEAIKLDRPVFAVPGGINSQMSRGTIKLLKQGAILVSNGKDILEKFEIRISKSETNRKLQNIKLSKEEKQVVELVMSEAMSLDLISKRLKIPTVKLMVLVSSLEMRGILESRSGEISLVID